jgi:hypothetical protein
MDQHVLGKISNSVGTKTVTPYRKYRVGKEIRYCVNRKRIIYYKMCTFKIKIKMCLEITMMEIKN